MKVAKPVLPMDVIRYTIEDFVMSKNPLFQFDAREAIWETQDIVFGDSPDESSPLNNFEGGIGSKHSVSERHFIYYISFITKLVAQAMET